MGLKCTVFHKNTYQKITLIRNKQQFQRKSSTNCVRKGIINHFNGLKQTQSEFSQLREESETAAPVVSNETKT